MLARRLQPTHTVLRASAGRGDRERAAARRPARPTPPPGAQAAGRWRDPTPQPTRGPHGAVRWWERPPPRGDAALWAAVRVLQTARQGRGMTVSDLARRLRRAGHPLRRETLSRVLNGKQPTTWATVDALAVVLDVDLDVRGEDLDA